MGCDVHMTAEVRRPVDRAEYLQVIQSGLDWVDGHMGRYSPGEYDDYIATELGRLRERKRALVGLRNRMLLNSEQVTAWVPLGDAFDYAHESMPYRTVTRTLLDGLTDGQLLEALAWYGRPAEQVGEHDDYRDFREALPEDAREALAAFNARLKVDREVVKAARGDWRARVHGWSEANPERAAEYDDEIPDDHPLAYARVVRSTEAQLARERRSVTLDPAVRAAIVEAALSYPADEEGEEDGGLRIGGMPLAEGDPPYRTSEPWDGRNYNLFAMLADVRNGYGFAGIETGDGFEPIADPRGVPTDAYPDTVRFLESYGVDGHSHTFHTLAQLRAYDWDQTTTLYGVVAADVYERLVAEGRTPTSYSGAISGAGITTFTSEGYERWKAAGRPPVGAERDFGRSRCVGGIVERPYHAGETRPYVRMEWQVSYREAAGERWFRTLDDLAALVPEGGTDDDVRILMFFDN